MSRALRPIQRKSTSLSLDSQLVTQAKELDIDISRVAEEGITKAIAEEKTRLWKIHNREALHSLNEYVEKHGLPLEPFRQF